MYLRCRLYPASDESRVIIAIIIIDRGIDAFRNCEKRRWVLIRCPTQCLLFCLEVPIIDFVSTVQMSFFARKNAFR